MINTHTNHGYNQGQGHKIELFKETMFLQVGGQSILMLTVTNWIFSISKFHVVLSFFEFTSSLPSCKLRQCTIAATSVSLHSSFQHCLILRCLSPVKGVLNKVRPLPPSKNTRYVLSQSHQVFSSHLG